MRPKPAALRPRSKSLPTQALRDYSLRNKDMVKGTTPAPPPPPPAGWKPRLKSDLERIKKYKLAGNEVAALQLYTTSTYILVNKYLRGQVTVAENNQINQFVERTAVAAVNTFDDFIGLITSAMRKLPVFQDAATVTRGVSLLGGLLEQYQPGQVVTDLGFMSTTFGTPFARDSIIMFKLLEGHAGRELSWLSKFEQEQEVLFLPGTSYKIDDLVDEKDRSFEAALAGLVENAEERERRFKPVVKHLLHATLQPPSPNG